MFRTPPIYLTRHALDVMRARGVHPSQVEEVVTEPEIVEADRTGYRRFKLGDLCVVTADRSDGALVVVTVLWRRQHRWSSEEMRAAVAH